MVNERIKKSLHTWNTIAESFHHTRQHTWDFCLDYISTLDNNSICADLGCGNGRHLIPLAQQCSYAIGFDISFNLLSITAKMLRMNYIENTSLIQGDLCSLPIQSNVFDHIIYIAALHNIKHKKNRIQSLKGLYRVLKPHGTALVSVWSRDQDRFKQKKFKQENGKEIGDITIYWRQHNLNVPRFYHLYEKQEFIQDISKTNFQIKSIEDLCIASKNSVDNYYAILQKKP